MREKYESLSATVLRDLAKSRGIKSTSTMKKADLVEAMLAEDAKKEKKKRQKNRRKTGTVSSFRETGEKKSRFSRISQRGIKRGRA